LSADGFDERAEVELGLRFSELRAGRFLLNGRARYLKGALVQPNYPLELVGPHDPALLEREIAALRAGGFNLARVHLRPPAPGFLERADRAGLLVYVETALAWIHPHERLRERGEREVRETLRLVRNHPSVALYGCFNENRHAAAQVREALLALGQALDPTRPIVDDSGGSAVDEGGGWHGQSYALSFDQPDPLAFNDLHFYFAAPLRRQAEQLLLEIGSQRTFPLSVEGEREVGGKRTHDLPAGAVFVSEFGYGGLPDVDRVAAGFGAETGTVDAQDALGYRDSLHQGVAQRGLDALFGGVAGLVAAAQRLQARGDARQAEALRLNPHTSGYVLTQLNDAAWELSAGVVDLWREPKAALAAMARVNAPRVLVLRAPPTAWPGASLPLELWLVDEAATPTSGALALELRDPADRVVWSDRVAVAPRGRVAHLARLAAPLPDTPGGYRLHATLTLSEERVETEQDVLVLPAARTPAGEGLQVLGDALRARLPRAAPWSERPGALPPRAARWARAGGHLVLLDLDATTAPPLAEALGLELQPHGTRGSFLG